MTLLETLVAMVISGLLLGGVLAMMVFSAKLVASAPADTNPHSVGVLAAQVARLEGSLAIERRCTNPAGAVLRSDCIDVETVAVTPVAHDGHAACWGVVTAAGRRMACWELLPQGEVIAHIYGPDGAGCAGATISEDCLRITSWASEPSETLPTVSGLAALAWDTTTTPVTLTACAAIQPDQRLLMDDDDVPFCDGTVGLRRGDGTPHVGVEGYPLPALQVTP